METKQTIPAGTKWGLLTYLYDVENHNPRKRPIKVQCECGVLKTVDLSALRSGSTHTCGQIACKNRRHRMLQNEIEAMQQKLTTFASGKERELNELREYWREIELTGNIHNVANGMVMTHEFLK